MTRLVRAIAVYLIVEPSIRNTMQVVAGVVAIGKGAAVLGIGLLVWALGDMALKALAGTALLQRGWFER